MMLSQYRLKSTGGNDAIDILLRRSSPYRMLVETSPTAAASFNGAP
jgi:hypothetical protein